MNILRLNYVGKDASLGIAAPKPFILAAASMPSKLYYSMGSIYTTRAIHLRREQTWQCHATGTSSLDKLGKSEDSAAPAADLQRKKVSRTRSSGNLCSDVT